MSTIVSTLFPKLALCMIVKNESKIIERCLLSVLDLVDTVVICDTGSTDNTIEIMHKVLETKFKTKEYCIFSEPWKDFGYNRTVGLVKARKFITRELLWDPNKAYMLTIDADMELDFSKFKRTDLNCINHSYTLQQFHGTMVYDNRRLLQASHKWISSGVTHEVNQAANTGGDATRLTSIRILDHNDGSSHAVKGERDEILLRKGLEDEPDNVRYLFYLANTLRESGDLEKIREAIDIYKRHRSIQQWEEEKWHSLLYMGQCWEALSDATRDQHHKEDLWNRALRCYLAAYQERNVRAEPLYRIAHYYRTHDQPTQGFVFALAASSIPFPAGDILFVEKSFYDFFVNEELSICSYWAGRRPEGWTAIQNLLRLDDNKYPAPSHIVRQALYNFQFYIDHFKVMERAFRLERPGAGWVQFSRDEILGSNPENAIYQICNPSMVTLPKEPGVVLVCCRAVNYNQERVRVFTSRDPDGCMRTHNFVFKYNLLGQFIIPGTVRGLWTNGWEGSFHNGTLVHGLEDCRIYSDANDCLWCSATVLEVTNDQRPKIVRFQIDENGGEVPEFNNISVILGQQDGSTQKNWLPVNGSSPSQWLFGLHQSSGVVDTPRTRMIFVNADTGITANTSHDRTILDLRGSSGPIDIETWRSDYNATLSSGVAQINPEACYLVLYHAVCDQEHYRFYYSKWIVFRKDWTMCGQSDIFVFKNLQVEMATGMVLYKDTLYLTLGIEDREAWMLEFNMAKIMALCI
jgi:glycosyltransferase involved in cell wall biosynthesis